MTKSEDCSFGLHEYCIPCECECHGGMMEEQHALDKRLVNTMDEKYALLCALCKVYDNYITPFRTRVSCWKCLKENSDSDEFIVGISTLEFDGSKSFITYDVPIDWWPLFNIIQYKELPGTPEINKRMFILNL